MPSLLYFELLPIFESETINLQINNPYYPRSLIINTIIPENTGQIPQPEAPVISLTPLRIPAPERSQTMNRFRPGHRIDNGMRKFLFLHFVLFDLRLLADVLAFYIDIGLDEDFEKLVYFAVIIYVVKLVLFLCFDDVHLAEELVHVLRAEFEILFHFLDPFLVHFLVVFLH